MNEVISCEGLKKYYPIRSGVFRRVTGHIKSLDGVDLVVNQGETVAVVGESGSGKTTLARALIRLVEPTEGNVWFEGQNILHMGEKELRKIRQKFQIVFQDPFASLNPRKTVVENLGAPLLLHALAKTEEEVRAKVAFGLEQVGISPEAMERYPHEFSGGQQQRICIGRAILLAPKLLILDEAVSALDVSVQAQVLNLLQELKRSLGLSYLFIAHDLAVVRHSADRVVVMRGGRVVEEGNVNEIFDFPKTEYTKKLLDAIPRGIAGRKKTLLC